MRTQSAYYLFIFFCFTGILIPFSGWSQQLESDSTTEKQDSILQDSPIRNELSISEFTLKLEESNQQLHAIENQLLLGYALSDVFTEYPVIAKSVNLFVETLEREDFSNLTLNQLNDIRNRLQLYRNKLSSWQAQTLQQTDKLSLYSVQTTKIQNTFADYKTLLKDSSLAPMFRERTTRMLAKVEDNKKEIHDDLAQVIDLQNNISSLQIMVNNYLEDVSFYSIHYERNLIFRDAPVLWDLSVTSSGESFFTQLGFILRKGRISIAEYLKDFKIRIFLQIGIFVLLLIVLITLKDKAYKLSASKQVPNLEKMIYVLDKPFSSALLFALTLSPLIYLHPPTIFIQLFFVLMLIPLWIIILKRQEFNEKLVTMLISLAYFFSELETISPDQTLGERIVLLIALSFAICSNIYFLVDIFKNPQKYPQFFKWLLGMSTSIFVVATIANIFGYATLASMLTHATTQSLIFGILVFMVYRMMCLIISLIVYSKRIQRSSIIKQNQKVISISLFQIAGILCGLYWVAATLVNFNIYNPIYDTVKAFLLETRTIGSIEFSIWSIVIFVLIIWISVTLSRLIKYMLEQQYLSTSYQRNKKGAFILLVRYFTLLLGFFIAIAAAGIPLDKITIILGALSVGIGFGLQNIINNLVSGFILAVERPIQTGDIIEVGTYRGVVKDIGIRSSTVSTFDGAEVIIPNANFISGEVTNWTLSNKHRRIEILVGVAYGSDPDQVIDILKKSITNKDDIMAVPEPMALFQDFGDSSLDFRLLFWVYNMDNWLVLRSSIMGEIYRMLDEANIEIPFPQRDLHIKSGLPETNGHFNFSSQKTPKKKGSTH